MQGHLYAEHHKESLSPESEGLRAGCGFSGTSHSGWLLPLRKDLPHFCQGTRCVCVSQRSALWNQSLLPPLCGFHDAKIISPACTASTTKRSPQPPYSFCLAMGEGGSCYARSCFPHSGTSCSGRFIFFGNWDGQKQECLSIIHALAGSIFPPSLLSLFL